MDGPRIHRVKGAEEALAEVGATACYLPAYSPELNPIEMTWSWVKAAIRKVAPRQLPALRKKVHETWSKVTSELCVAWIRAST